MIEEPSPKEVDAILLEVGRALNNFSYIEQQLEFVFCAISNVRNSVGPVIMASIVSLEARVKVCDNITKVGPLPDDLAGIWKHLSARILKQHKKRHDLAHFRTLTRTVGKGKPVFGIEPYGSAGRMFMQEMPGTLLTIEEVKERRDAFLATGQALEWLEQEINRHRGRGTLLPELQLPEPPLVQELREKAAQTQKAQ